MAISYSTYLTYCNFINCAIGVEITASQTFVGLIFTTCTYDVKKTNASTATVTNTFNSNAGTYDPAGDIVTFVTSVTLTLGTTSCPLVVGSEIEILLAGTQTEEVHEEASGTTYAYPYNWIFSFIKQTMNGMLYGIIYFQTLIPVFQLSRGLTAITIIHN
jgi:hypothetical protein